MRRVQSIPAAVYLALGVALLAVELHGIGTSDTGDTISELVWSTPWLLVPMTVLVGWAVPHFATRGRHRRAEALGALVGLIAAIGGLWW